MVCEKGKVLLVLAFVVVSTYADRQVVTVDTNVGTINGYVKKTTYLGETYKIDRFQGIPYAEAPVGERRFQKALPKAPFARSLDAFAHGKMCMQLVILEPFITEIEYKYSEDCLYLNIYAPHSRHGQDEKLPVMVWIYGGGFNFGYTDIYLGDNIAAYGNVIVVTISYRLSAWGFLSTGTDEAPGNAGLWDQHMGIKWIHDNIEAFGGDNQRVTLFGDSSGSASVIYQALYPGNKGLFQRIIGQSGSVSSYWASLSDVTKHTNCLAEHTNCKNENTKEMIKCLQKVSNDKIVEIIGNVTFGCYEYLFPFDPVKDDDFVRYEPRTAFDTLPADVIDIYRSIDVMTGVNSADGSTAISPFLGVEMPEEFQPSRDDFKNKFVMSALNLLYSDNKIKEILKDLVVAEYTDWNNPDDPIAIRQEYVNMHGDIAFVAPCYSTLNKHAHVSGASTFMYLFDIKPSTKLFSYVSWLKGLAHAEEIPAVFGYKSFKKNGESFGEKAWELQLSKDVITLWTNFAKTGNPNKPVNLGLDWLPYTEKQQHYLHITRDMTSSNVKQRWNTRRVNFWTKIVPKIANGELCTKSDETAEDGDTCDKDGECSP
ncbi:hypothetical protein ACF0H5_017944 [Mactra antiquata]